MAPKFVWRRGTWLLLEAILRKQKKLMSSNPDSPEDDAADIVAQLEFKTRK